MKRREFLVCGGALLRLPFAGCLASERNKPSNPISGELVDVHCHIFNASDLPEVRFIKIVVLHHYPEQAIKALDMDDPDVLVHLLRCLDSVLVKPVRRRPRRRLRC